MKKQDVINRLTVQINAIAELVLEKFPKSYDRVEAMKHLKKTVNWLNRAEKKWVEETQQEDK